MSRYKIVAIGDTIIKTTYEIEILEIEGTKNKKEIFIGWSGNRSKKIANILREWIPLLIKDIKPWVSFKDIIGNWSLELEKIKRFELGIFCITQENLKSPWIHFEAGKIGGLVCPYLIDVSIPEIHGPLQQFQCFEATEEGTLDLVGKIGILLEEEIEEKQLKTAFYNLWPILKEILESSKCPELACKLTIGDDIL